MSSLYGGQLIGSFFYLGQLIGPANQGIISSRSFNRSSFYRGHLIDHPIEVIPTSRSMNRASYQCQLIGHPSIKIS